MMENNVSLNVLRKSNLVLMLLGVIESKFNYK